MPKAPSKIKSATLTIEFEDFEEYKYLFPAGALSFAVEVNRREPEYFLDDTLTAVKESGGEVIGVNFSIIHPRALPDGTQYLLLHTPAPESESETLF